MMADAEEKSLQQRSSFYLSNLNAPTGLSYGKLQSNKAADVEATISDKVIVYPEEISQDDESDIKEEIKQKEKELKKEINDRRDNIENLFLSDIKRANVKNRLNFFNQLNEQLNEQLKPLYDQLGRLDNQLKEQLKPLYDQLGRLDDQLKEQLKPLYDQLGRLDDQLGRLDDQLGRLNDQALQFIKEKSEMEIRLKTIGTLATKGDIENLEKKIRTVYITQDIQGSSTFAEYYNNNIKNIMRIENTFWFRNDKFLTGNFNSSPPKSDKESDYQQYFFGQLNDWLPTLGSLLHIEDTSNNPILDNRKPDLCFFFGEDPLSGVYVAIVGEIKKKQSTGLFSGGHIGEVLTFGERCLKLQPLRMQITVFLTDCYIIQFFKIEKSNEQEKKYYCTSVMGVRTNSDGTSQEGILALGSLLTRSREELGVNTPIPKFKANISLNKLLGRGATSIVYEGIGKKESYAVKCILPEHEDVCEHELHILSSLSKVNRIPKVVEQSSDMLLLKPIGEHFRSNFKLSHLKQIIETLQMAHRKNIVHRDIRPDNLLMVADDNEETLVIDWGFAVRTPFTGPYSGTLHFASDRVLMEMEKDRSNVLVSANDDLHSLIRAVYGILFPNDINSLLLSKNSSYIRTFWKEKFQGKIWENCEEAAESVDYEKIIELFSLFLAN